MLSSKAIAIKDPEIENFIRSQNLSPFLFKKVDKEKFIAMWKDWSGEEYEGYDCLITEGVTAAYDDFEREYPNLQTVTFRGEYPYHRSLGAIMVETKDLKKGQKLIISDPFAAHGNQHEKLDEILSYCDHLGIPVFVDRAYFGLSLNKFETSECVKYIAYSFSKMFYTGRMRLGVCFKKGSPTKMDMLNEYNYLPTPSAILHQKLMTNFSKEYLIEKYKEKQIELCKTLNVYPSDSVIFGYTFENKEGFSREGYVSRICLSINLPLLLR